MKKEQLSPEHLNGWTRISIILISIWLFGNYSIYYSYLAWVLIPLFIVTVWNMILLKKWALYLGVFLLGSDILYIILAGGMGLGEPVIVLIDLVTLGFKAFILGLLISHRKKFA